MAGVRRERESNKIKHYCIRDSNVIYSLDLCNVRIRMVKITSKVDV